MSLQIKKPILMVGVGGAGIKMACKAGNMLGCDQFSIGNSLGDLQAQKSSSAMMTVDTGAVINPTVGLMRAAVHKDMDRIRTAISGHPTVIMVANLAGKTGCAVAPAVIEACKAERADLITLAIMPFGHEKSTLFTAGVTLRRVREGSACTVVLDNDALSESNPDLTPKECYEIADAAVMHMFDSVERTELGRNTENILAAGRESRNIEESLRDALKTTYGSVPPGAVGHSLLYVTGGENTPTRMLRSAAMLTEGVLNSGKSGGNKDISRATMVAAGSGAVAEATASDSPTTNASRVVMLTTVQEMTKFERYDPLGAIPDDKTIDWSTLECSIEGCKLDIYQME